MGSCETCKHTNKGGYEEPCKGCTHNAKDNYEPITNADRIRSMTDEELADFIEMKQFFALTNNGTDGEEYTLAWLKSEVGCE